MSTAIFEDYNSTYNGKRKYKMWTVVRNLLGLQGICYEINSKYFSERELPRSMEARTKRISMTGDDYAMF